MGTYAKQTWADGPSGNTPVRASRLNVMEDGIDAALRRDGGTMTGDLTLKGAPTADLVAATKKYVDDLMLAWAPQTQEIVDDDINVDIDNNGVNLLSSVTLSLPSGWGSMDVEVHGWVGLRTASSTSETRRVRIDLESPAATVLEQISMSFEPNTGSGGIRYAKAPIAWLFKDSGARGFRVRAYNVAGTNNAVAKDEIYLYARKTRRS